MADSLRCRKTADEGIAVESQRKSAVARNAVGWWLLAYRVPSDRSAYRVGVWRELKRLGALYLQQSVCVLPRLGATRSELEQVRNKIDEMGGSADLLALPHQAADQQARMIRGFRDLASEQYRKVTEECERTVIAEIEFETFRKRFTMSEVEEIEQNLEKVRRWYAAVRERDWFDAPGRTAVEASIEQAARKLPAYVARVHRSTSAGARSDERSGRPAVNGSRGATPRTVARSAGRARRSQGRTPRGG